MEEKSYKKLEEKRGELVELPLEELVISELNARHAFIDEAHVKELAETIAAYGFRKERAIQVNVIRDASGQVRQYRVVAGAHRFLGAFTAGLTHIPCHLYYELTEEEECLLDTIDNKIDEKRKRVHFLAEAEHFKYLIEKKGWSQLQLSRVKGVSRSTIQWKLKIAALPDEAKTELLNNCHHGGTLTERHMREVLKLSEPENIIMIIKEIIARWQEEEAEEGPENRGAMKQKEVAQRVAELVALEEKRHDKSCNHSEPIEKTESGVAECDTPDLEVVPRVVAVGNCEARGEQECCLPTATPPQEREEEAWEAPLGTPDPQGLAALRRERLQLQAQERAKAESEDESEDEAESEWSSYHEEESGRWSTEEMPFDRMPRWLKFSSLQRKNRSLWPLLQAMIGYALRFRNHASKQGTVAFFLGSPDYTPQEQEEYLAQATGVGVRTVRRNLGQLEQKGFIRILPQKRGRAPLFQVQWVRLKKVYDKEAESIPYREGGIKDLPEYFTGLIQPTPLHDLWFRNGKRTKYPDYTQEKVRRELAALGLRPAKIHQLLQTYDVEHLELRLDELPRHQERYARQNKTIHNILGFFLQSLDTRFPI